jgi:hypothetical protein
MCEEDEPERWEWAMGLLSAPLLVHMPEVGEPRCAKRPARRAVRGLQPPAPPRTLGANDRSGVAAVAGSARLLSHA